MEKKEIKREEKREKGSFPSNFILLLPLTAFLTERNIYKGCDSS